MNLIKKDIAGIVHVVGDERISKYDFCHKLAKKFDLPVSLIERGRFSDTNNLVLRPHDMSLSNEYVKLLHGTSLGDIDDFLTDLNAQERRGRAEVVAKGFVGNK